MVSMVVKVGQFSFFQVVCYCWYCGCSRWCLVSVVFILWVIFSCSYSIGSQYVLVSRYSVMDIVSYGVVSGQLVVWVSQMLLSGCMMMVGVVNYRLVCMMRWVMIVCVLRLVLWLVKKRQKVELKLVLVSSMLDMMCSYLMSRQVFMCGFFG